MKTQVSLDILKSWSVTLPYSQAAKLLALILDGELLLSAITYRHKRPLTEAAL